MARKLRFTPDGGALYEVTCRTVHSRFLLRPGPLLNEVIVGALGRAQRLYPLEICAFFFASNHFHLLARAEDSERLARFMGYFNSKLAREVARSTGWRDKVFSRRYQAILVSDEEEAQVGRLVYILSHGCKENLVARPQEWPGVHCVTALLTGEPIEGTWFSRTKEWQARQRGEEFGARQFADPEVVTLSPLPCWRDPVGEPYRARIAELVEAIVAKAAARQVETGIEPLGPAAILRQQPFSQPAKTKKSPAPRVHAASKKVRTELKIAYAWFVRTFREAAEYLRAGDRLARFPRGSFPPGLPFVRAGRLAIGPAT
ncbi:MAG: transposase [Acidobacteriota bacterium]